MSSSHFRARPVRSNSGEGFDRAIEINALMRSNGWNEAGWHLFRALDCCYCNTLSAAGALLPFLVESDFFYSHILKNN